MAGLCAPLPTLRRHPRGCRRTARGRGGSLRLPRGGLAPPTPCRSPGALRFDLNEYRSVGRDHTPASGSRKVAHGTRYSKKTVAIFSEPPKVPLHRGSPRHLAGAGALRRAEGLGQWLGVISWLLAHVPKGAVGFTGSDRGSALPFPGCQATRNPRALRTVSTWQLESTAAFTTCSRYAGVHPQGDGLSSTSCVKKTSQARRRAASEIRRRARSKVTSVLYILTARSRARSIKPVFNPSSTLRATANRRPSSALARTVTAPNG